MPRNNTGLGLSSFQQGVVANLPTTFPGDYNVAFYYATDTGTLYIAGAPDAPSTAVSWFPAAGGNAVIIPDAATYTALAANSGKLHIFPDLTANCTVSLPLPTAGLNFTFTGKAGAADAQSWIITGTPTILKGGVLGMDTDAGAGSDELVPAYANGSTHVRITVATPDAGCLIRFVGDGTNWLISGQASSAAAPVFA